MPRDKSPISGIGRRRDGKYYPKYPTKVSFGVLRGKKEEREHPRLWDVMLGSTLEKSKHGEHNYTTKVRDMVLYKNYSANKWLQDEIITNYPKLAPSQVLQKELDGYFKMRAREEMTSEDFKGKKNNLLSKIANVEDKINNVQSSLPKKPNINKLKELYYEILKDTELKNDNLHRK